MYDKFCEDYYDPFSGLSKATAFKKYLKEIFE